LGLLTLAGHRSLTHPPFGGYSYAVVAPGCIAGMPFLAHWSRGHVNIGVLRHTPRLSMDLSTVCGDKFVCGERNANSGRGLAEADPLKRAKSNQLAAWQASRSLSLMTHRSEPEITTSSSTHLSPSSSTIITSHVPASTTLSVSQSPFSRTSVSR